MLDFDLAKIDEVSTKALKQAVRRNIERFPDDFMFELSEYEYNLLKISLRSQIVTSNNGSKRGGIRYMPFAFTQEGVAMLTSVLRSPIAIQANINIMRAFVAVRQLMLSPPLKVFTDYDDINEDTRTQLELINEALAKLQTKNIEIRPRRAIGYGRRGEIID